MIAVIEWLKRSVRKLYGNRKEEVEDLPWTPVQSSCVAAIMYVSSERTLYLRFNDNATYCYLNCPARVAVDMVASISKGTFLWREVRGRFVTIRLQPPY